MIEDHIPRARLLARFKNWVGGLRTRYREWKTTEVVTLKGRQALGRLILTVGFAASFGGLWYVNDQQVDGQAEISRENCEAIAELWGLLRLQINSDAARWDGLAAQLPDAEASMFARDWANAIRSGAFLAASPKLIESC